LIIEAMVSLQQQVTGQGTNDRPKIMEDASPYDAGNDPRSSSQGLRATPQYTAGSDGEAVVC
jgi:hypothetical protein